MASTVASTVEASSMTTSQNEVVYGNTRARFSSAKIAVIARVLSTQINTDQNGDKKTKTAGSERDTMTGMIKQLLSLDNEYEKEMAALRRDLHAATKLLSDKDAGETTLQAKVDILSKKKTADSQTIADLTDLVKSQGRTLAANKIEIQALKTEVAPLRDALKARESAHLSQSSLVSDLEKVNEDLKRKYKLLHQKMDVEIQKLRAAQYDKAELARENRNYKKTVADLLTRIENNGKNSSSKENNHTRSKENQSGGKGLKNTPTHKADARPFAERIENGADWKSTTMVKTTTTQKVSMTVKNDARPELGDTSVDAKAKSENHAPARELAKALAENNKLRKQLDKVESQSKKPSDGRVEGLEREVDEMKKKLEEKQSFSNDLQKQLNKVVAEYKAIAIAHEYASAEASKLRHEVRAPGSHHKHGIRGGVNLLRHRKHHAHANG